MSVPDILHLDQPLYITIATRRGHLKLSGPEREACIEAERLLDKVFAMGEHDCKISVKARDTDAYTRSFGYLVGYRAELQQIEARKAAGTWPA